MPSTNLSAKQVTEMGVIRAVKEALVQKGFEDAQVSGHRDSETGFLKIILPGKMQITGSVFNLSDAPKNWRFNDCWMQPIPWPVGDPDMNFKGFVKMASRLLANTKYHWGGTGVG